MKLLQLNIWFGKVLKQTLAFIEREQPDILCLQEVYSSKAPILQPDMMFDSLEQIQKLTGYQNTFFSPTFTTVYTGVEASFGNAVVSRYPLSNANSFFTNGEYNPNATNENVEINTRVLQTCWISIDGKSFSLANYHGHSYPSPIGNEVTIEKMKIVKSKIEQLPKPIILSGDLNVSSESPAMRVFDGFLRDLTSENKITTTLSQLGKVTDVACDHILISDGIEVTSFRVADDLVSDHKALIMEFEL